MAEEARPAVSRVLWLEQPWRQTTAATTVVNEKRENQCLSMFMRTTFRGADLLNAELSPYPTQAPSVPMKIARIGKRRRDERVE